MVKKRMTSDIEKYLINENRSIKDALMKIDVNHCGIIFSCNDDGKVLGLATDGDIRRAIIKGIKLEKANDLTFDSPDNDLFPCLNLAYQAFSMGMASTIILNAANEVAVDAFLKKIIPFTEIPALINSALQSWAPNKPSNIEDVLAIDSEMRIKTMSLIANR